MTFAIFPKNFEAIQKLEMACGNVVGIQAVERKETASRRDSSSDKCLLKCDDWKRRRYQTHNLVGAIPPAHREMTFKLNAQCFADRGAGSAQADCVTD